MKSTILVSLVTVFLVSVRCLDDYLSFVKTLESSKIPKSQLSFSFNKKDYSDFKCNFNDKILTHESLKKPPFYYSISISNFFSVFCFIFQYSAIISDENFKNVIESLVEGHFISAYQLRDFSYKFVYDPLDYNNYLVKLENKICELIYGKDKNNLYVNIEENEERIIVTPRESAKFCQLSLIEEFVSAILPFDPNFTICDKTIEFLIKFNEAYLQDRLKKGYIKTLRMIIRTWKNENNNRMSDKEDKVLPANDVITELVKQYGDIPDFEANKKNNIEEYSDDEDFQEYSDDKCYVKYSDDEDFEEYSDDKYYAKYSDEIFTLSFTKYLKIVTRKHPCRYLLTYLAELASKVKTKVLLALTEDCGPKDIFIVYADEVIDSLKSLKNMLFELLRDPTKIDYGSKKLSDESIRTLGKKCLDIDI